MYFQPKHQRRGKQTCARDVQNSNARDVQNSKLPIRGAKHEKNNDTWRCFCHHNLEIMLKTSNATANGWHSHKSLSILSTSTRRHCPMYRSQHEKLSLPFQQNNHNFSLLTHFPTPWCEKTFNKRKRLGVFQVFFEL